MAGHKLASTSGSVMSIAMPPNVDFEAANGRQLALIRTTFLAVFVRRTKLAMFLSDHLNKNFDALAEGDDFEEQVFNLLRDAQAEGWLAELVAKAIEAYARATPLQNMLDQWFVFAAVRAWRRGVRSGANGTYFAPAGGRSDLATPGRHRSF
jgi:Effector-associated domain 1